MGTGNGHLEPNEIQQKIIQIKRAGGPSSFCADATPEKGRNI